MATIEFITKEDLKQFRQDLLQDLKEALRKPKLLESNKEWLKSYEVREILKISPSTLQTLRITGTLPYSKIGGLMYYKNDDIKCLLEGNRSEPSI